MFKGVYKKILLSAVGFLILLFFTIASAAQTQTFNMREYFPLEENRYLRTFTHSLNGYEWEGDWAVSGTEVVNGVETYRRYYTDANNYECLLGDNEGLRVYKSYNSYQGFYSIFDPPLLFLHSLRFQQDV